MTASKSGGMPNVEDQSGNHQNSSIMHDDMLGEDDEVKDDEPDDESCTNMLDGPDEFAYD